MTERARRNLDRLRTYVENLSERECRERILDALRCAFPEDDPEEQWEAETVEYVLNALLPERDREGLGLEPRQEDEDDDG